MSTIDYEAFQPGADALAHESGDHSACGADTECHDLWLAQLAKAGESTAIQDHVAERHNYCHPEWRCHQVWVEALGETPTRASVTQEVQSAPLEADGGGRVVEAVVQHHMRGHIEQDVSHFGAVHPHVLEVRKGDDK